MMMLIFVVVSVSVLGLVFWIRMSFFSPSYIWSNCNIVFFFFILIYIVSIHYLFNFVSYYSLPSYHFYLLSSSIDSLLQILLSRTKTAFMYKYSYHIIWFLLVNTVFQICLVEVVGIDFNVVVVFHLDSFDFVVAALLIKMRLVAVML